jgi:competence ComEA-like helix-hairpin-helix protein
MADKTGKKTRHAKSDLNRADRDELVSVPGIGPAGAESILKQRGDRGGFKSLDELSDVTGIGAQAVQNLRERFTISGKRAGAAESASKGAAKAPEVSLRTTEQTAKRGVEIAADTTKRSADTAAEIAGRSADVAGDAGKRTIEAAAQTGKTGMKALEHIGDKSREAPQIIGLFRTPRQRRACKPGHGRARCHGCIQQSVIRHHARTPPRMAELRPGPVQ